MPGGEPLRQCEHTGDARRWASRDAGLALSDVWRSRWASPNTRPTLGAARPWQLHSPIPAGERATEFLASAAPDDVGGLRPGPALARAPLTWPGRKSVRPVALGKAVPTPS